MVSPKSALKSLDRLSRAISGGMGTAFLIIVIISSGCVMVKLKKEAQQFQVATILVGHISTNFSGKGTIVVAACTMDQGKRAVAHYSILHDAGKKVAGCS